MQRLHRRLSHRALHALVSWLESRALATADLDAEVIGRRIAGDYHDTKPLLMRCCNPNNVSVVGGRDEEYHKLTSCDIICFGR